MEDKWLEVIRSKKEKVTNRKKYPNHSGPSETLFGMGPCKIWAQLFCLGIKEEVDFQEMESSSTYKGHVFRGKVNNG